MSESYLNSFQQSQYTSSSPILDSQMPFITERYLLNGLDSTNHESLPRTGKKHAIYSTPPESRRNSTGSLNELKITDSSYLEIYECNNNPLVVEKNNSPDENEYFIEELDKVDSNIGFTTTSNPNVLNEKLVNRQRSDSGFDACQSDWIQIDDQLAIDMLINKLKRKHIANKIYKAKGRKQSNCGNIADILDTLKFENSKLSPPIWFSTSTRTIRLTDPQLFESDNSDENDVHYDIPETKSLSNFIEEDKDEIVIKEDEQSDTDDTVLNQDNEVVLENLVQENNDELNNNNSEEIKDYADSILMDNESQTKLNLQTTLDDLKNVSSLPSNDMNKKLNSRKSSLNVGLSKPPAPSNSSLFRNKKNVSHVNKSINQSSKKTDKKKSFSVKFRRISSVFPCHRFIKPIKSEDFLEFAKYLHSSIPTYNIFHESIPEDWAIKKTNDGRMYFFNLNSDKTIITEEKLKQHEESKDMGKAFSNKGLLYSKDWSIADIKSLQTQSSFDWDYCHKMFTSAMMDFKFSYQFGMRDRYMKHTNYIIGLINYFILISGFTESVQTTEVDKIFENLLPFVERVSECASRFILTARFCSMTWPIPDVEPEFKKCFDRISKSVNSFIEFCICNSIEMKKPDEAYFERTLVLNYDNVNKIEQKKEFENLTSSEMCMLTEYDIKILIQKEEECMSCFSYLIKYINESKTTYLVSRKMNAIKNILIKMIDTCNSLILKADYISKNHHNKGQLTDDLQNSHLEFSKTISIIKFSSKSCLDMETPTINSLKRLSTSIRELLSSSKDIAIKMKFLLEDSDCHELYELLDYVFQSSSKSYEHGLRNQSSSIIDNNLQIATVMKDAVKTQVSPRPRQLSLIHASLIKDEDNNYTENITLQTRRDSSHAGLMNSLSILTKTMDACVAIERDMIGSGRKRSPSVGASIIHHKPLDKIKDDKIKKSSSNLSLKIDKNKSDIESIKEEKLGIETSLNGMKFSPMMPLENSKNKADYKKSSDSEIFDRGILLNDERKIKGFHLDAFIKQMTLYENTIITMNDIETFFLTYRTIITPTEMVQKIISNYDLSKNTKLNLIEPNKVNIDLRLRKVLDLLYLWLEKYFLGDEEELIALPMIKTFISKCPSGSGTTNLKLLLKLRQSSPKSGLPRIEQIDKSFCPVSITSKNYKKSKLIDISPLEIARQLSLMEFSFFRELVLPKLIIKNSKIRNTPDLINSPPFMGSIKLKDSNTEDLPTTQNKIMSERSTKMTQWVVLRILHETDIKKRVIVIKHIIAIANYCKELHNYNTTMEILAGLTSSPIHRLKKTWEIVPKKTIELLESLQDLMSVRKNFNNYRTELRNSSLPCIPFFGLYLTDLTFVQDGNPDTIKMTDDPESLINFSKKTMLSDIIKEFMAYQSTPYALNPVPEIQTILSESISDMRDFLSTEKDVEEFLYDVSRNRE